MFDGRENFIGEKKIAEMLSSLKRVDAPGDFDTRVRARIARGEEAVANSWTTNLIRIGAPLAAAIILALGGYFVFTLLNTGQNDVPTVAASRPESQQPVIEQPLNTETTQSSDHTPTKPSDDLTADNLKPVQTNSDAKPSGPNTTDSNTATTRPGGGSTDMAVRESEKLYPRGVNPNAKAPANAKGVDPNARTHVSSILEFIGVKATWAGDGWRVDAVEANNIAGRSGIKSGDVIEAINGQTVDKKTTFPAKFDGKSVRVRRDGASVQIDFKP